MKKIHFLVIAGVVAGAIVFISILNKEDTPIGNQQPAAQKVEQTTPTVTLGSRIFKVDVVETEEEQAKGLAVKSSLAEDAAMLFVFEKPNTYCIWMKDMKFNIDILWYDENKQLIFQKQNAAPSSYPEQFCPPANTKYILETNTGIIQKIGQDSIKTFGLKQ